MAAAAAAAFALPGVPTVAGVPVRRSFSRSGAAVSLFTSRSDFLGRSLALPAAPQASAGVESLSVFCGRGDKKTEKGKRFNHSYGNARPRNKNKGRGPPRVERPPAPPRKDKYDDGEIVKIEIDESLFS